MMLSLSWLKCRSGRVNFFWWKYVVNAYGCAMSIQNSNDFPAFFNAQVAPTLLVMTYRASRLIEFLRHLALRHTNAAAKTSNIIHGWSPLNNPEYTFCILIKQDKYTFCVSIGSIQLVSLRYGDEMV